MVAIIELIDPRPYVLQVTVYGNLIYLIYTVTYGRDRLLSQANPNALLPCPFNLRIDAF
jgi:hypothetical protein